MTDTTSRTARCPDHPEQSVEHCGPCRSEMIGRLNWDREHGMTGDPDPDPARGDAARRHRIALNRWNALVDPEFAAATLRDFPDPAPEVRAFITAWNTGVDPCPWLLIAGPTGTGKTHLEYAVGRELATGDRPADWIATSATAMYQSLRPSAPNPELALYKLQTKPLLLIDDLGVNKASEWVEETTHSILDERYRRRLPVILTTNLDTRGLKAAVGERMASRLRQRCLRVVLDGPDRRHAPTLEGLIHEGDRTS